MKVTFFETNDEDQNTIKNLFAATKAIKNADVVFFKDKVDASNVSAAKDTEVLGIFIHSKVTKEIINSLPELKLIVTMSTGFDHIDVAYAKSKNIDVCNVPSYGSRTVAEFTFGLILGLSRKMFQAFRQVKDNHDFDITHFKGFNLQSKVLGVVGTGRIGLNVIKIAKGFDMNVLGFDAFPNEKMAKELGFKYTELDELLKNSDVITLHVPYNQNTHHLINLSNINKIKKGAVLINTSRGEVVETEAVMTGIKQQILSGVGLDVLEGEKDLVEECSLITTPEGHHQACAADFKVLLEDHLLISLPEVAITPHIAFFTEEAKQEILRTTVENIFGWQANQIINSVK